MKKCYYESDKKSYNFKGRKLSWKISSKPSIKNKESG
jgi:hypothetical protein